MELKPGYKQTEVGVIPEDWDVRPLSNISLRIMVGIASAATHAYRLSGIPMIRNQNIKPGHLLDSDLLFIDQEYEKTYRNKRLLEGDLLTTRTGYPGTTCIVPAKYKAAQSFTTLITRPDIAQITSEFLCLFINSEHGQRFFESSQIGGAQKNVNTGTLKKMPIPIPTVSEQTKVSNVLGAVEELLASIENLIAKKRAVKQAAMQELLTGKRRLPGFEGEWETVALSQVSEKITGFWGRTESGNEAIHSTNVIRAGDISEEGRLIGAARRFLSHHEISVAGCRPGDTVMTASGNGLGKSWTCNQDGVYSASNFVRIIRPQRGKADGHFIGYALKSRCARSKLVEHTATSAYPNLKPSFFNDRWLSLPPQPEQKAISEVLQDVDIEIDELEARKLKASQLKQGMMQQLLTGKIRLQ
ncbi:restriction endonuclease subunit S [Cyanobium sp. NS01]|uniref:restriction endonuclease subunit S n=1 Tax=Cyanobium sp. NS01 TaxID=261284 RepID=UPI001645BA40|nr:restriction endonuclease subunit S [Cyanobium sp. NS01]QNI69211.1 Putative Type I restriction-modification system S subunit [Cyanobium sp. NS01]